MVLDDDATLVFNGRAVIYTARCRRLGTEEIGWTDNGQRPGWDGILDITLNLAPV